MKYFIKTLINLHTLNSTYHNWRIYDLEFLKILDKIDFFIQFSNHLVTAFIIHTNHLQNLRIKNFEKKF